MNKFWEWMEEKEAGFKRSGEMFFIAFLSDNRKVYIKSSKQLTIGYMIEYCIEHKIKVDIEILEDFTLTIDKLYDYLKQQIEG